MRTLMRNAAIAAALAALPGCVKYYVPDTNVTFARIGQTIYVGGPSVTPLEVLEDSRCPAGTECFWKGQFRMNATVHGAGGDELREFTINKPVDVNRGALTLTRVRPDAREGVTLAPDEYSFGFVFDGNP